MDSFSVRNYRRRGIKEADSTAMIAVALQDHYARTLSLGLPRNPRNIGLGPAARAKLKKEVKPVIDTGLGSKRHLKPKRFKEEEYVLDTQPPPLTLAQKFGLVEAPPELISETEWQKVKYQSNRRDDSRQPCVICKEHFGLQEQVLLSCTHVFHRACLEAFERFTGRKTCPMCRREQYQTRVIHEGAKAYKHICAIRIQSAWRGYVVRCWYKKLRETRPPQDPKLRKKFFEEKFKAITDRMVRSCDFDINEFLREIDNNLAASRDIFRSFDAMFKEIDDTEWEQIQLKAVERGQQECPICLTLLTNDETDKTQEVTDSSASKDKSVHCVPTKQKQKNFIRTSARDASLQIKTEEAGSVSNEAGSVAKEGEPVTKENGMKCRQTVLLSCTHVFHETCLVMLEELALGEVKNTCPICRAMYQKKVINLVRNY